MKIFLEWKIILQTSGHLTLPKRKNDNWEIQDENQKKISHAE